MPMMVNDGSLGVKQLMAVLLHQDFGMGASKNRLSLPNVRAKILPTISDNTYQFAAHPFHHVLIDANDGKWWFFGYETAHGSLAGSRFWQGCKQKRA
jgi:hypothetical protein